MKQPRRGFTLVELMIVVAIIGILAAIAVPNFIRFQAKSKQAEAKTNLKALFVGQRTRYADADAYSPLIGEVGFAPERGNRYAYDLGAGALASNTGLTPTCTTMEVRNAATTTLSGAGSPCGIAPDIFRYKSNIVPSTLAGRASAVFSQTIAGNPGLTADSVGVNLATCPTCDFSARAVGNIDNDPGGDEHFVASQFLSSAGAACSEAVVGIQPGNALNVRNDVNCE